MFEKIKSFCAGEAASWKRWELAWFAFCFFTSLAGALYLKDSLLGTISSLSGICYTILAGKGKISCYFFGILNSFLYGWISYRERLFGEVMLNWGWYFPMMFVGLYCWKQKLGKDQTILKRALSFRGKLFCYGCSLAGIGLYGWILRLMKDAQPFMDSSTTVLSVTAMILTVKRCADQWLLWTVVNILSIWMWVKVFRADGAWGATLFMWIMALANGILFFVQWYREIRLCTEKEQ